MVGTLKHIGLLVVYWLAVSLAVSTFDFVLMAETQDQPRLNHIPLLIWSLATVVVVGFRSHRITRSLERSVLDGIVAGAIMYGGIALVSVALQDMTRDFEAFRESIFWRVALMLEVALVYAGTMILIRSSTAHCKRGQLRRIRRVKLKG